MPIMYLVANVYPDGDNYPTIKPLCIIDNLDEEYIKQVLINLNFSFSNFVSPKFELNSNVDCQLVTYDKNSEYNREYQRLRKVIKNLQTQHISEYFKNLPFNIVVNILESIDNLPEMVDHQLPIQIFPIRYFSFEFPIKLM